MSYSTAYQNPIILYSLYVGYLLRVMFVCMVFFTCNNDVLATVGIVGASRVVHILFSLSLVVYVVEFFSCAVVVNVVIL